MKTAATVTPKIGLTVREAAAMLGVGYRTLYGLLAGGKSSIDMGSTELHVLRIGARIVIPRAEIERVLGERAS